MSSNAGEPASLPAAGRGFGLNDSPELTRERLRSRRFFNLVAPAFAVIDRHLLPAYRDLLKELELPPEWSVLDLASGTGTLAQAFSERGHSLSGIDFAVRLLRKAEKRVPEAHFRLMDLANLGRFADSSFDLVSMAYLLHGVPVEFRNFILSEARRIAIHQILIFDYPAPGPWYVRLIERIEGPHYPDFVSRPFPEQAAEAGLKILSQGLSSGNGGWWLACAKG